MNDDELMFQAWRALSRAGGYPEPHRIPGVMTYMFSGQKWLPLDDDAAAMRLAIMLNMLINIEKDETEVAAHPSISDTLSIVELHNGDALAATRRAIVRCAAAGATL